MLTFGRTENKGRGVFAKKHFLKGELIEKAPVILFTQEQIKLIDQTILYNYYFFWKTETDGVLALGLCSLCNHSENPNTVCVRKFDEQVIELIALQDIEEGEEITHKYKEVWFDVLE